MSRVGILGGTFNPIHNGHLIVARHAYSELDLDYVLIIPNHHPQYRSIEDVEDEDRINMIKLAVEGEDAFVYSDIEMAREGATYTVDTLRELKELSPSDSFYFIMGADSLMYFDKWRQSSDIVKLSHILIAVRGDDDIIRCNEKISELGYTDRMTMLKSPNTIISSSYIREYIKAGRDITGLVPDRVRDYILERGLYI